MKLPRSRSTAWIAAGVLGAVVVAGAGWATLSNDSEGSAAEFCAAVADRERFASVVEDFDPTDVSRALDQLQGARAELDELHELAPGEIRDELDVQRRAVDALLGALETVEPGDSAGAVEAVNALGDELHEVPAATQTLEQWTTTNCVPPPS